MGPWPDCPSESANGPMFDRTVTTAVSNYTEIFVKTHIFNYTKIFVKMHTHTDKHTRGNKLLLSQKSALVSSRTAIEEVEEQQI